MLVNSSYRSEAASTGHAVHYAVRQLAWAKVDEILPEDLCTVEDQLYE